MTYLGFLALFLLIPLTVLAALHANDRHRGRDLPHSLRAWPVWVALAAHVLVALLYTAPWDNYLVATGVWWYAPQQVTGATLGWVPLEEYVFFTLQPLVAGLWLAWLARRLPDSGEAPARPRLRCATAIAAALIWLASLISLLAGWKALTYLALELVWALPAIVGQLAFGADILWHRRRLIALVLIPVTLLLSGADALAISQGIWTIDPAQSLNIFIGSVLPFEEFAFFLLTNALLTFGVVLVLSIESRRRARTGAIRPSAGAPSDDAVSPGPGGKQ